MKTLIAFEDAAFAYEGKTAVSGLRFNINEGDYLCVVGENGSGKSSLLKGMLKLIPPSQGRVTMDSGLKPGDIGYLPQQTAAQKDFPAGVQEVVLSGRLGRRGLRPFYTGDDRAAVREHMRLLGIYDLRNRCFRELSGGQRQRVLLARALCAAQKLLVLDEPVTGLDPAGTGEVYRHIYELNRQKGLTVVMVTHDLDHAARHADHILQLQGRPVFYGTAAEYVRSTGKGCEDIV